MPIPLKPILLFISYLQEIFVINDFCLNLLLQKVYFERKRFYLSYGQGKFV